METFPGPRSETFTTVQVCRLAGCTYDDEFALGSEWGSWTVTGAPYSLASGKRAVSCLCACGVETDIQLTNLRSGRSQRCRRCAARSMLTGRPPSSDVGEVAWAAGLFEGEGSIFCTRRRKARPRMQLSSTDEDVLRRFHRIVGRGAVYGPYTKVEGHLPRWDWITSSIHTCEEILSVFAPYLGDRRRAKALEVMNEVWARGF